MKKQIIFEYTLHGKVNEIRNELVDFLEEQNYEKEGTTLYYLITSTPNREIEKLLSKLKEYFNVRKLKKTDEDFIEFSISTVEEIIHEYEWPLN